MKFLIKLMLTFVIASTGCGENMTIDFLKNRSIGPVSDTDARPNRIAESAPVGTATGLTASARDPDTLDTVSYTLSEKSNGLFRIHSKTGIVTSGEKLDFESADAHELTVRATSTDGTWSEAVFTVNVTDDRSPTLDIHFPPLNGSYSEGIMAFRGLAIDPEGGGVQVTVVAGSRSSTVSAEEDGSWMVSDLVLNQEDDRAVVVAEDDAGERVEIPLDISVAELLDSPYGFAADDEGRVLYMADLELAGIYAFDTQTMEIHLVSGDTRGTGPGFGRPRSVAYDSNTGELLVTDIETHSLLGVDPDSGNRRLISSEARGTGTPFGVPLGVVYDPIWHRALVSDTSEDTIVSVHLSTGDRTVVSGAGIGAGPDLQVAFGMALDTLANTLFIAEFNRSEVLAVDLSTGDRRVASGFSVGEGQNMSGPTGIALADESRSLMVANRSNGLLISIDPTTGNRAVVADLTNADGLSSVFPSGVFVDADERNAYVTDIRVGSLLLADLDSGDVEILVLNPAGSGPMFGFASDLLIDPVDRLGYVVEPQEHRLLRIDLASGERSVVSDGETGSGPWWDWPTYASFFGSPKTALVMERRLSPSLFSVDLVTGDRTLLASEGLGTGPSFESVAGAEYQAGSSVVWIPDTYRYRLVAIDLDNGNRMDVTTRLGGGDSEYNGFADTTLDSTNGHIYVADSLLPEIGVIDVRNGNVSTFQDLSVPVGDLTIGAPSAVAYAHDRRGLFVANGTPAFLALLDVETHDSEIVSGTGTGSGPELRRPRLIGIDEVRDIGYVFDSDIRGLVAIDLITGHRVILAR